MSIEDEVVTCGCGVCWCMEPATAGYPVCEDCLTGTHTASPTISAANPAAPEPRKCRPHRWETVVTDGISVVTCARCGRPRDAVASRRGRNSRSRGNREELVVARSIGGKKMGPLGLPWDVEMPGYARLQVKKLATAPSLRFVAAELSRIGSGAEMPGFVWVEPGRGGERLIVFRLVDFAERHGIPEVGDR